MRNLLPKLLLSLSSLLIGLIFCEIGLRYLLFSDIPGLDRLRHPGNYADYFSDDDYFKLKYLFGHPAPRQPHPLLGWVGSGTFDGESYLHDDIAGLQGRRPVLLYGDSFAGCVRYVACFEDILNTDPEFAEDYYLLNYGVGNYGFDQIALLFQNSVSHYKDPFVIMSLMTLDLDRSIQSARTGQKPYFTLENNELALQNVPINPDPHLFFAENPPKIKSYVYRRLTRGYLPKPLLHTLTGEAKITAYKKQLNEKIMVEVIDELRARDLDFIFLVFHPHWPGVTVLDAETDWRDPFLRDVFDRYEVPYIWSKDLALADAGSTPLDIDTYLIPVDGHPNEYFNRIIAQAMKGHILATE